MLLTLLAVCCGLLAGRLTGGDMRRLGSTPIRYPGLMVAGLILPALVTRMGWPGSNMLIVLALVAVVGFAGANMHMVGMGVVLIGVTMNLAPILANGAMPVRAEALTASGLVTAEQLPRVELAPPRELEQPGDKLTFLGDIIPLSITKQVLSFGDLVLLMGIADVAFNLSRRRRRHVRRPTGADRALAMLFPDQQSSARQPRFEDQPRPSALLPDGSIDLAEPLVRSVAETTASPAHD